MLTPKQLRFCEEYIIDLNGAQAAIRAGYKEKTSRCIAAENLTKPNIEKKINELQEALRLKAELDAEFVVQELRELAEWNIQDFLSANNTIKDLTTLTRKATKPVSGIKVTEKYLPDGTKHVITELKLVDKRATWVDLGRHTGIFKEDNEQRPVVGGPMSDDQFNKLLNAAREASANTSQ